MYRHFRKSSGYIVHQSSMTQGGEKLVEERYNRIDKYKTKSVGSLARTDCENEVSWSNQAYLWKPLLGCVLSGRYSVKGAK